MGRTSGNEALPLQDRPEGVAERPDHDDVTRGRSGRVWMTLGLVALALLAVGFHKTFRILWNSWDTNPNYSHGFLILPIALVLVWRRRDRLAETPVHSTWWGVPVVAGAVALQILGTRGDVAILQGWALLGVLGGLLLSWFGTAMMRSLLFPWAFLFFMVPAHPAFMNGVSFRLKVVAAEGSVWLAQLLGVSVARRGMDLFFPSGTLTIENACSGLNSLIALLALGALFAHLGEGPMWKKWLLFLLAVPVAVAANVVRITSLAVAAAVSDVDRASGLFHDIGGFVLFGVALAMLAGIRKGLRC